MIIPMLTCVDTEAEIAFCKEALGASLLSERLWTNGRVIHATLAVGQALFMVHGEISHLASHEPKHDGSSSVVLYLYLADPDKTIEDALRAGASVLLPAKDEP